jgi:hypothetical protein
MGGKRGKLPLKLLLSTFRTYNLLVPVGDKKFAGFSTTAADVLKNRHSKS